MRLTRDLGGGKFDILSVRASKRSRLHFDDLIVRSDFIKNGLLNRYGVLAAFDFWVSFWNLNHVDKAFSKILKIMKFGAFRIDVILLFMQI